MGLGMLVWLWKCYWFEKTFGISNSFLNCWIRILPSLFIGFDLNTSSNSLQSSLLYEATLFPQFIDHVHSHNLSNVLDTTFLYLVFCVSILLQLHILLSHWWLLVMVLALYVVLWTVVHCILLVGLHWTHCELPIFLEVPAKIPLNQCPLRF